MLLHNDEIQDVDVCGRGPMRMHLFRPAGLGRYSGVLMFSEIYQVTAPIRRLEVTLLIVRRLTQGRPQSPAFIRPTFIPEL